MESASVSHKHRLSKDRTLRLVLFLYTLLLLFSIILSCFFSYKQKNDELQSQIDVIFSQLSTKYQDITNNFWQLYMPFFESSSYPQDVLRGYISDATDTPLTPIEQNKLEQFLRRMLLRDHNVKWIVIYGNNRSDNYILYSDFSGLELLPEDFPLLEKLESNPGQMAVYSLQDTTDASMQNTFAICGGIPYYIESGKLLVGYSTAPLESICDNAAFHLDSLSFVLTNQDSVIFDYHGSTPLQVENPSQIEATGNQWSSDGKLMHAYSEICGSKTSRLVYYASQSEIFLYCHSNTPLLIALFFVFAVISILGYTYILRQITKEVLFIQDGLNQISENNLSFRIESRFQQDYLSQIAHSVNEMAERLNHNINLAYYYEIKQREAELSELQSKFNPHFLYNTLEILRSRCQQNADEISVKLITDLSTIFRGFISTRNFVPMAEELAFSKRYLSLFSARYGDSVEVRYDFDREILKYGIIKNVFQPLIENYFVHGFDTCNDDNYILLQGRSVDEETMLITIEDNGIGMAQEDIDKLNQKLNEPIAISTESYGLKNLHQRLSLFYGGNCGLTICANPNAAKGLTIQITAKKMTCEEYEENRKNQPKIPQN